MNAKRIIQDFANSVLESISATQIKSLNQRTSKSKKLYSILNSTLKCIKQELINAISNYFKLILKMLNQINIKLNRFLRKLQTYYKFLKAKMIKSLINIYKICKKVKFSSKIKIIKYKKKKNIVISLKIRIRIINQMNN